MGLLWKFLSTFKFCGQAEPGKQNGSRQRAARPAPCLLDAANSARDAARSTIAQAPRRVEIAPTCVRGTARAPATGESTRARGSGQDLGSQRRLHARKLLLTALTLCPMGNIVNDTVHDQRRRTRPAVSPASAPSAPRRRRRKNVCASRGRSEHGRAARTHATGRRARLPPLGNSSTILAGPRPRVRREALPLARRHVRFHSASCCARLLYS